MTEKEGRAKLYRRSVVWPVLIYAVTLALGIGAYLSQPTRNVAQHYETAANHWLATESLYEESMTGHGFLYFPQAAIMHVPYAIINQRFGKLSASEATIGDIVWRVVSWLVFVFAVFRFTRSVVDRPEVVQLRVAFFTCLLGLSCVRNGQSTLLMTGLMILCIEAWRLQRYRWASLFVIGAIAVKPLAIVLALLLFAISKPMRIPLLVAAAALVVFPFATQSPSYVVQQYSDCIGMLSAASGLGQNQKWAQLFGLLNVLGVSVSANVQTASRVLAALVVLGVVVYNSRVLNFQRQAIWLYTLAAIFLMLFNPRTENSTYCMLGPVFGLFIGELVSSRPTVSKRRQLIAVCLCVLGILTACSHEVGKAFTPDGYKAVWLAPLCCCVFTVYLIGYYWFKETEPKRGFKPTASASDN